jgi:crotonobetainyl-CoA:carnitine CoA-transferase CaiB-like acyl-CoA transferase
MINGPMDGIRVIELASWTFVPAAGSVLAEWGADVIKIEHPSGGDPQRGLISSGMVAGGPGRANYLVEQPNHNKRSLGLDVKHPEGREVLLELCRKADVFLTNWLPGQRGRAMVDVEDIRKVNPDIVYARGSGYGVRGPDADKPGFDSSAFWARSGAAHSHTQLAGDVYGPNMSAAFGDLAGAQTIAGGIAAALLRRERTGESSIVDISLLALGMWMMSPDIVAHKLFADAPAQRYPRESAANPIANRYRTADGRVVQLVMLQSGRFWAELVEAIGRPELATDERFAGPQSLYDHRVEAVAILDEVFATRTLAEWRTVLEGVSGSWAAVQKPIELHDDVQAISNGYLVEVHPPSGDTFPLVPNPVQFDERQVELAPAPDAGEHTDEILAELGLAWDRVIELKLSGAVL